MASQLEPLHINAKKEDIASVVLLPGDPLRAKYIAETYLEDAKLVTSIRNMLGYTGTYKGVKVTVMGSGMGMPSVGIYSYELYTFYNVKKIIRIGTCGAVAEGIEVADMILASNSYSESNFAYSFSDCKENIMPASKKLNEKIIETANELGYKLHIGDIFTMDIFGPYVDEDRILNRVPRNLEIIGEEMEAFGLFHIAQFTGRDASCIATVTDSKYSDRIITEEERERNLNEMITLALHSIIKEDD